MSIKGLFRFDESQNPTYRKELNVVFEAALQKALNFLSERGFKSGCLEESRTAFQRPLGRISDISSEDTLGLTIFENHILKFQGILFFEKIARV